jgi:hypothetical protein
MFRMMRATATQAAFSSAGDAGGGVSAESCFGFIGMGAIVGAGFFEQGTQGFEFAVTAGAGDAESQGLIETCGVILGGLQHVFGEGLGGFGVGLGIQCCEGLKRGVGDGAFDVRGVGVRAIKGC